MGSEADGRHLRYANNQVKSACSPLTASAYSYLIDSKNRQCLRAPMAVRINAQRAGAKKAAEAAFFRSKP